MKVTIVQLPCPAAHKPSLQHQRGARGQCRRRNWRSRRMGHDTVPSDACGQAPDPEQGASWTPDPEPEKPKSRLRSGPRSVRAGDDTGVDRTGEEWGSQAAKTTRQGNQAATTTSRKRTRSDHVKVLDVPAKPLCTDQLPSWDDILMHH